MNQNLMVIGQKLTTLINNKLQEPQLSKEDYLSILHKLEIIVTMEYKLINGEIIEPINE